TVLMDVSAVVAAEGSTASFDVRLSGRPAAAVELTAIVAGGSGVLSISGGASHQIEPDAWEQPRAITLAAAQDDDEEDQSGTIELRLNGVLTASLPATQDDASASEPPPATELAAVTVQGARFYSNGKPWFLSANFLSAEPGLYTQTYLSDDISNSRRQHMLDVTKAQGYNAIFLYTLMEGDYNGERISPYASGVIGGAFDDAKIARWRGELQKLLQNGLRPVLWLIPDDSGTVHNVGVDELKRYITKMVAAFDDLPVMWILALEIDEYFDKGTSDELGSHLQSLARNPVGLHQTPGRSDYMTSWWVEYAVFQFGFSGDGFRVYDTTLEQTAALGNKPFVAGEYDLDGGFGARAKGLSAAFAGAAGTGNGAPAEIDEFMAALPDGMTAARVGDIATLTGGAAVAVANLSTLTFGMQ
ncbi:MAG: hypothetical protein ACREID_05930, partial [Planctomycetota bacterium]